MENGQGAKLREIAQTIKDANDQQKGGGDG